MCQRVGNVAGEGGAVVGRAFENSLFLFVFFSVCGLLFGLPTLT